MAEMAKLHPGLVHVALLLLMSTLIGAMFPVLKVAEHTIPPFTITILPVSLATITMLLTVTIVRTPRTEAAD